MFKAHKEAGPRRASAQFLVVHVLNCANDMSVSPKHLDELLGNLLWKLTEAEAVSKYKTRFQSRSALASRDKSDLRHEHVFQRKKMIAELRGACGDKQTIAAILDKAVACTITRDEHRQLKAFDREYGWERYRLARIEVVDTHTGKPLTF